MSRKNKRYALGIGFVVILLIFAYLNLQQTNDAIRKQVADENEARRATIVYEVQLTQQP